MQVTACTSFSIGTSTEGAPTEIDFFRGSRAVFAHSSAFVRSSLKPGHEVKRARTYARCQILARSEGRCCAIAADAPRTTLERSVGLLDGDDEDLGAGLEICSVP
jgi:hypothetical protein